MKKLSKAREKVEAIEKQVGHRVGLTRRDFLAHGILPFSACLALPSAATLIAKNAFADQSLSFADSLLPLMTFDMAGGGALAGNFLVGKSGGPEDWLPSYSSLGWNPRGTDAIDRRFGLPMSADKSGIFKGLIQTMSPGAQANLRMASVCHASPADTMDAQQNIAALAVAAGRRGVLFSNGVGNRATDSGGNSRSALIGRKLMPTYVYNTDVLSRLLMFGGGYLPSTMSPEQIAQLAVDSRMLTAHQMDQVQTGAGVRALKERVREFVEDGDFAVLPDLDPRKDALTKSVYEIQPNSAPAADAVVQATIARTTLLGYAGTSIWTLGGCDYHTGTNVEGDKKDLEMGMAIGRAVELAHRMQRPFFFQLITDGSCSAEAGTRNWKGDTNEGMQVFGYYRPTGAPEYLRANMQLGAFTDGEGADRSTVIGADPNKAALAVFANYCHIQGKIDVFKQLVSVFNDRELEQLLIFAPG